MAFEMAVPQPGPQRKARRPYQPPIILQELDLETHAGSPDPPGGVGDPLDPFGDLLPTP